MENSKTHEKTIKLGKQLVAELERDPETDFLCRWMAHYLAEQITLAENTTGRKKAAARKNCFNIILTLWKHRAALPNGHRPFEKFEPVLNALHSLDPDNPRPFYHQFRQRDREADTQESKMVSKLIDLIFDVDSAARVLVDAVLIELTELATTQRTRSMLESAPKVGKNDSLNAVGILIKRAHRLEPRQELENSFIKERLKMLKYFSATCKILEDLLEKRLAKASETPGDLK